MAINSQYFNRDEFACKCGCGFNPVDAELLDVLEAVRERFGPTTITSGCRCKWNNEQAGGSPNSQHMLGKAADIKVSRASAEMVGNFLEEKYASMYGIGRYTSWTHIDVREGMARWGRN